MVAGSSSAYLGHPGSVLQRLTESFVIAFGRGHRHEYAGRRATQFGRRPDRARVRWWSLGTVSRMPSTPSTDLRARVAANPIWYHTIELPGVVTPGWFDLRPVVDRLPWPDVDGKRCLDVGTYDGFLAFELERRGASEVVAIDIDNHDRWDWPPDMRAEGGARLAMLAGPEKGRGFRVAHDALGSRVTRRPLSVYDLDAGDVGTFDIVVCGTLLLHLRDPLRALEAIRGVCRGQFLSAEQIDLRRSALHPRTPLAYLNV